LTDAGKARPAVTHYERLERVAGHSLVRVTSDGGRKRQIRRHLAGTGHPVVGDTRHGHSPTNRHFSEKLGLDRCFLHLGRVELADPTDGRLILLESPLAADLAAVLLRLADARSTPGPA
jgi:23S rRNA pseudouridine1911/1915/1917 synthase